MVKEECPSLANVLLHIVIEEGASLGQGHGEVSRTRGGGFRGEHEFVRIGSLFRVKGQKDLGVVVPGKVWIDGEDINNSL